MVIENENTKIYTVFTQLGLSHNDSSLVATTNEEVLHQLQRECDGVDFVVRDLTKSANLESVLNEISDVERFNYDGVLVIGDTNVYKLALTGLPTIVVHHVIGFMHIPYKLYISEGKILFASLDRVNASAPPIASAMFEDLVAKIDLIRALRKMKDAKLLLVNASQYVSSYYRGDKGTTYLAGFNENILGALDQSFGTAVQKLMPDEVYEDEAIQHLWVSADEPAEEIAKMWLDEAKEMRDTLASEVVKSAKMYLAFKLLLEKYNATAIAYHLRSLIKNPKREELAWPSLGDSELQKQGIVACCQSHLNVVLTHMLAQYAFGRPSMMGDFTLDPFNHVAILQHCGGPWNPRGGDDRVPYIIRDHAERGMREHAIPGVGACSEVLYPPDEPVTIWRTNLLTKEILLHTGTTVDGYSLYKEYANLM